MRLRDCAEPLTVRVMKFEGSSHVSSRALRDFLQRPMLVPNENAAAVAAISDLLPVEDTRDYSSAFLRVHILVADQVIAPPCDSIAFNLFSFSSNAPSPLSIELPIRYSDVTESMTMVVTLHRTPAERIAQCAFALISPRSLRFRSGRRLLRLSFNNVMDPERLHDGKFVSYKDKAGLDPLQRIEKQRYRFERGSLHSIDWLDGLVTERIRALRDAAEHFYIAIEVPEVGEPLQVDALSFKNVLASSAYDPQAFRDNPCEVLLAKQDRHSMNVTDSRQAKPDSATRDRLERILCRTCLDALDMTDQKLLWHYRYYLTRDKRALTKFLRCVDWKDQKEVQEAHAVLHEWCAIDTSDALELLSSSFTDGVVRLYAVSILQQASDTQILKVLLQLVQALRYETEAEMSPLAQFLIERATHNYEIATLLYWYLVVEDDVRATDLSSSTQSSSDELRARQSRMMGPSVFVLVRDKLTMRAQEMAEKLEKQHALVQWCISTSERLSAEKNRMKKIDVLKTGVATQPPPLPASLPVKPHETLMECISDDAYVFKSAKTPILLSFRALSSLHDASSHHPPSVVKEKIIFKCGDDLRQDQLVMQLVNLMDDILKANGLDLKLTPYSVLSTSADSGIVECIDNVRALAEVLADYKGEIVRYLEAHNSPKAMPTVMDNFLKSCAGYSVITYLLGIGDRHLDNLLLTRQGNLFHIDFGFILGRDPKPYPPPMKLSKEIVQAMGDDYDRFKTLCCEAFNILRKSASLILNLLVLMLDANIPDLSGINVKKIHPREHLLRVQEKFRLDLSDEEAVVYLQTVINESVKALFPQITEAIHRIAQQFRS